MRTSEGNCNGENYGEAGRGEADMGVKWTEEQQQVIDLRDHNILVSAAAGSGKRCSGWSGLLRD